MDLLKYILEILAAAVTLYKDRTIAVEMVFRAASGADKGILFADNLLKTRLAMQLICIGAVAALLLTIFLSYIVMYQLTSTGHSFIYCFTWSIVTASSSLPFIYITFRK